MVQNEDMILWDVKLCNKACGQNQSNRNKSLYKKGKPDFTIKKIDNYLNKKERKTSL